jgi:hypothetical protein
MDIYQLDLGTFSTSLAAHLATCSFHKDGLRYKSFGILRTMNKVFYVDDLFTSNNTEVELKKRLIESI